jgi:hypothetical protein
MKPFEAALLMLALLLLGVANCNADRLYTWTDANGVTHITQDPPPDTTKAVTIDYSPQPNRPVNRSTGSDQTNQQQGNLVQGSGQSWSGSGGDFASGDEENDVPYQYEAGPYRRTLLQYEIKHKILDDNEPVKRRDLPERVKSRAGKK